LFWYDKNVADIFVNVGSRDSFKIYVAVQIILIPDILESVLDAKDTETKSLRRQLQDIESKLMVHTYEKSIDTNNLRVQLEEKCKRIQELEDKVARLEKVDLNIIL
jgi:predicted ABC-class ATPase